MARKSTKKKASKKAKKPAGPGLGVRLRNMLGGAGDASMSALDIGARFGPLLVGLLLVILWFAGKRPLQNYVAAQRADPLVVDIAWPSAEGVPTVPDAVRRDIEQYVRANVSMDPFETEGLEFAQQMLERSGWVERVERIERKPKGLLEVRAAWRSPVAVVRVGDTEHVIAPDASALYLPPGTRVEPGTLPVLINPSHSAPRDSEGRILFGSPWLGGDVQAGIALLGVIERLAHRDRIDAIDLAPYRRNGFLNLVTDTGGTIVWGAAPGEERAEEVDTATKLRHVDDVFTQGYDRRQRRIEVNTPVVLINDVVGGG